MNSSEAWKVIQDLRRTRGLNAKKNILSIYPEIQPYIFYTYNPFLQYNVSVLSGEGTGDSDFTDETWDLLDRLHNRAISGNAAKNAIRKHLGTLNYASMQVFACIINKSFDIGLGVKSINEVFPNSLPTFDIQLAKPVDWKRVKFPCYISPKLDGLRALFINGKFYSRRGHELQGLTQLSKQCIEIFGNEALDGELMIPGTHFDEISGKVRSFKEAPEVTYNVFDFPWSSAHFYQRYGRLTEKLCPCPIIPSQVVLVPHYYIESQKEALHLYDRYRREGYEGAMLKSKDGLYQNARTWDWQKIIETVCEDLKVIGTFEGEGKYEGLVGGIYVDHNGVKVAVGGGLSDRQRMVWSDDPDEILGRMVEIAFQEVTPQGSLRHPRLVQVRGDL